MMLPSTTIQKSVQPPGVATHKGTLRKEDCASDTLCMGIKTA